MPKPDLGVKRVCPESGKKFYDLNKDPIVSPFTGQGYPLSYFEDTVTKIPEEPEKPDLEDEVEEKASVEATESAEEEDAPELDETPIDMGDGEDEDDTVVAPAEASNADADEFEGFSDEEADLDDDVDDSLLLDDEDDDDLGTEIDINASKDEEL